MNKDISYNIILQNEKSTVVSVYSPSQRISGYYQSEADLEKEFIKLLQAQAYEYKKITNEEDLILNLREQLEKLNDYEFSDNEWNHFFKNEIANLNNGIVEKTAIIQENETRILKCDDGTDKNIRLLDKQDIHKNFLQVINQYETDEGKYKNIYDVTILVNGLPLVHIELKRRGVAIKEAFNQINRYQRDSFWAASGLYEYIQIFVISNGTHTKYYSNTTRSQHLKKDNLNVKNKKTSYSFEFTIWWADAKNIPITDLVDFTKTFFAKHTILNILIKYCVFTTEKQLLVMRPYQIVATERILNKIEISTNYKQYGSIKAGGYIWHTTGSGKTLTSFKTTQLIKNLPYIDKVLFVVDRKDLDYQTMKEFNKFDKNSVNSTKNTAALKKLLENSNEKIIVTTIQKLDRFISKNKGHTIFDGKIVLIFDECHRSQFGEMHLAITKAFKKYYLFGFTGTPIFAINANSSKRVNLKTTEQAFGDRLHTYTIVNAINDKNVLPFKVDYISTFKEKEGIKDKKVISIDREKVLNDPIRIHNNVKYIIDKFDDKTKRNRFYKLEDKRVSGFNSIFAVSSIDAAKRYYIEFKKQINELPSDKKLKIATIFSYGVNEDNLDGIYDENLESTDKLDKGSREFLEDAIKDYNKMFASNYDTSSENFQNYYKEISKNIKNRELDLLIVVNMFLTGFDAKTLNTLWVDKNLKMHGLLQAFSRTNRILNSIKSHGNIICFRNLNKATEDSISLFGDENACGIVLLKTYEEYYYGYKKDDKKIQGYESLIEELTEKYPISERIIGEQNKKDFVNLYGHILKVQNILKSFDEFEGNAILSERDIQDYHSRYIDLYNEFKSINVSEKENINDDIIFEMELIKQIEINIDYILNLVKKYHKTNMTDKEILISIRKSIDSSVELRNKKDLILQFIESLNITSVVDDDWQKFVENKKIEELEQIIKDENLNRDETYKFIQNSFRDGEIPTTGMRLAKVLPPISLFDKDKKRTKKRETVIEKFIAFFNRFFNISTK